MIMALVDLTPVDASGTKVPLDVSDTRTLRATFTDPDTGAALSVSVSDVVLTIQRPKGGETQYTGVELVQESSNVVARKHRFTLPGNWFLRWDWASGDESESAEAVVLVDNPTVTPS